MGVNYGADNVRFPRRCKVGARIRGRGADPRGERRTRTAVQAKIRVTVEIEGGERPPASPTRSAAFFSRPLPLHEVPRHA